jgi:hypothetical protein
MVIGIRGITALGAALALGLALSACGTTVRPTNKATLPAAHEEAIPGTVPAGTVVVQVGNTPITRALYEHWMRVGDATVEKPSSTGALPAAVDYEPTEYTACVAHLKTTLELTEAVIQIRSRCQQIYKSIEERILVFLIHGYWLREEASENAVTVTNAELQKEFNQIKKQGYPTAAAFHRLLAASHQTVADLKFAVLSQMLSNKLTQKLANTDTEIRDATEKTPEAQTAQVNTLLTKKWPAKTLCTTGYIVKGCKQNP